MATEKEIIAELTKWYMEEESISESIKEVKSEAKEAGFDVAVLSAVAKAIVKNKVDDLKKKAEATVDMIEIARA